VAYSLQADIEKRIPPKDLAQLTDDTAGTTTVAATVAEAIALGDALINSHLRGKHTVPLATVPDLVRDWSVILAIYNLYQRRLDLGIPETLEVGFKEAIRQLKEVRDNKLMIDDAASDANTAGYYFSNKSSSAIIFDSNDKETGLIDKYFSRRRLTSNRISGGAAVD